MKKSLLISLVLLTSTLAIADIFDDIAVAIRASNSKGIARWFDSSVELKTLDKSAVYSKNQAELVLKNFFEKYPVKSFNIIHRGSSTKGAQYSIGSLETTKGTYRTYLFVKDIGGKSVIQEFSIEQE